MVVVVVDVEGDGPQNDMDKSAAAEVDMQHSEGMEDYVLHWDYIPAVDSSLEGRLVVVVVVVW